MAERHHLHTGRVSHYEELSPIVQQQYADQPVWLAERQGAALAAFEEEGFPLPSDEEWRFTPIGPIVETLFAPAPTEVEVAKDHPAVLQLSDLPGVRVVFVNGRYAPQLSRLSSMPEGVYFSTLREAISQGEEAVPRHLASVAVGRPVFTALNLALMQDGVFLRVPKGVVLRDPIHVLYLTTAGAAPYVVSPRSLIIIEDTAEACLIESFGSAGGEEYWTNAVTEVIVGPGASLEHYRLQRESVHAYHIGRTAVHIARDGRYTSHSVQVGAAIGRHDLGAVLGGEGIVCTLNGLYVGRGKQLLDNHTVIDHAKPHCESHEVYKGILADRAHGVFNGKVYVRPDAQKTDAKQSNHALLLSDAAHIDTKPQLEIFADDVRCTHGATVGQLDADALFYLRARGISADDARNILIHAFASEIVDQMSLESVRNELEKYLWEVLPRTSSHNPS